jgi:photosystem II stability/assembly factor-like uncharacterized protein
MFLSNNYGESWVDKGFGSINSLIVLGKNIYAGTNDGVWLSTDNGENWIQKKSGLGLDHETPVISVLATKGSNIFAGKEYGGVYLSTNDGDSWTLKDSNLAIFGVNIIYISESNIFVGSSSQGTYLSTDNGDSWMNISAISANSIAVSEHNVFIGANGVYLSTDMGSSWMSKNEGLNENDKSIRAIFIKEDYIFVGTRGYGGGGSIYRARISDLLDVKDTPTPSNAITLFPNPVTDNLYINITDNAQFIQSIEIYDQLGRLCISEDSEITGNHNIFVGDLPPSVYFVKIISQNSIIYKKFIKI